MKISIIIPTYNRADLITKTLESVYSQISSAWECIIVDDHSTDNTEEVVTKYMEAHPNSNFRFILNERRKGAQGARNTGIKHASWDFLMFLDSDDLLLPHCVKGRLATIAAQPDYDYYAFTTKDLYPDGTVKQRYFLENKDRDDISRFLTFNNPWHTMGCVVKKNIVCDMGMWDEQLTRFQDCDFYVRLVADPHLKGFKAVKLPYDSLFRANYSSDTISKSIAFSKHKYTYLYYMKKVEKLLKNNNIWESYHLEFIRMIFYIFSSFLCRGGKLDNNYCAFYVQNIRSLTSNRLKRRIYALYFKNRWSEKVLNSSTLTLLYKAIPKIFILPFSKQMLW